ncbi:hypothetical protein D3C76_766770 [compost metagenome]
MGVRMVVESARHIPHLPLGKSTRRYDTRDDGPAWVRDFPALIKAWVEKDAYGQFFERKGLRRTCGYRELI